MTNSNAVQRGRLTGAALLSAFFLLALPLAGGSAFGQAVFRWKDDAGVRHFTDDFSRIPARYRQQSIDETRRGAAPLTEETAEGPEVKTPAPETAPGPAPGSARHAPSGDPKPSGYKQAVKATRLNVDNLGRDKQYWQDRRRYWEQRLQESEALYAGTKREFNLTNQRYDKKEYAKLKELRERLRALETRVAKAKAMLDGGLAREARQAGAQPGWVR